MTHLKISRKILFVALIIIGKNFASKRKRESTRTHTHTYIYIHAHIYIYTHTEREREKERARFALIFPRLKERSH